MELWTHQQRGLDLLRQVRDSGHRNICVTAPTGAGKTRMMLQLLQASERVHVFTDRRLLHEQLCRNLTDANIRHGIIASGYEPSIADIQICMAQSVVSWCVNGNRSQPSADVIIFDEAHKMTGDGFQHIRQLYGSGIVDIGFTATPLGLGGTYDVLVDVANVSELRAAGVLVPAYHYAPDEPDLKWIGPVDIGGGECGIKKTKRQVYVQRVFGRVIEHYKRLSDGRPTVLFAPGQAESLWFAQKLRANGISAAHIGADGIWVDGEQYDRTEDNANWIRDRLANGHLKIVCNRFVLREGIDWPFVSHLILATTFGSLTSYLQAGGRGLRAFAGKDKLTVQDHGGNWWRHGSLNTPREWNLEYTDRIISQVRESRIREQKEREPIVCPKCNGCRLAGAECPHCGHRHDKSVRYVMQQDGTLKPREGQIYRPRRMAEHTPSIEEQWVGFIYGVRKSRKPSCKSMTFAQAEAWICRQNAGKWPPRTLPMMPVRETDWFRPIQQVKDLT